MIGPPALMYVRFPIGRRRSFGLWLPIGLIWILLAALLILLSPLLLLLIGVLMCTRRGRHRLRLTWAVVRVACAASGLRIDAEGNGHRVGIRFV